MAKMIMPKVIDGMRQLPFDAPIWFGKQVGAGTAENYIELYETDENAIARTTPH